MEIGNQSVDYRPLILVAEDDDSNFKLIKAIIGKRCEIMWAKNGEEIVSLFHENRDKTDAILMDIKMPIMNGLEATRLIREEGGTLPIIMQTAYAFSADRENAIKSGASEVLVKPITLQALRDCLRKDFMARLAAAHPDPESELNWTTPYELLVAVVLSAQATDKGVNIATAKLFPVANTPEAIVKLGVEGLTPYVKSGS